LGGIGYQKERMVRHRRKESKNKFIYERQEANQIVCKGMDVQHLSQEKIQGSSKERLKKKGES